MPSLKYWKVPYSGGVAAADVGDGIVDRLFGHVEAGVSRGAEEHQLPAGDREIGVDAVGVVDVAPAAAILGSVLGPALHFEREAERAVDGALDPLGPLGVAHAVHFARQQRGNRVVVGSAGADFVFRHVAFEHRPVGSHECDEAVFFLAREHEVGRPPKVAAVAAVAGDVAVGDEGHRAEAGDAGLAGGQRGERAVGLLLGGEPNESALDGPIDALPLVGGEHAGGRGVW